jgi:hypothetical protein
MTKRVFVSDADLYAEALAAAELPNRQFAKQILDVDERTARRYLAGGELHGTVRAVCRAIVLEPSVANILAAANAEFVELDEPSEFQRKRTT